MPEQVAKARPEATVSARVLDKNGKVLADLGTIAGAELTEKEKAEQMKKLDGLRTSKED